MECPETRDDFQLAHANAAQAMLPPIARKMAGYPNGRDATRTAGIKIKPAARYAIIAVYPVPEDADANTIFS